MYVCMREGVYVCIRYSIDPLRFSLSLSSVLPLSDNIHDVLKQSRELEKENKRLQGISYIYIHIIYTCILYIYILYVYIYYIYIYYMYIYILYIYIYIY